MLGGGQLGRMSLLAGRQMGYRFVVLDPAGEDAPAAPVADEVIASAFDDEKGLSRLRDLSDRVTLEFENIPTESVHFVNEVVAVAPSARVLGVCQNRRREKLFLREEGFPCAPFEVVRSVEELKTGIETVGYPCVLKTADFGYDGKGQYKLAGGEDLESIWSGLDAPAGVLEKWIRFSGEFSVICARNGSGEESVFPVTENIHKNHILHRSIAPARISETRASEAEALARALARKLEVVGLLTVELFLTDEGWVVNEMAPRPHNSGHHTIESCATSQFGQHIRAVCGLPLGDTRLLTPTVMLNLLGDIWVKGEPNWIEVLKYPGVSLHLYGKEEAKPGRKMGHLTVVGESVDALLKTVEVVERILGIG